MGPRRTRTASAALLAAVTVLASLTGAVSSTSASGAAGSPQGVPTRVTPLGRSTQDDIVTLLAGSPDTLVLSRQERLAHDADESSETDGRYATGVTTVYARSASGALTSLGTMPRDADRFSVVGTVVAAAKLTYRPADDPPLATQAYVWNAQSGNRHLVTLGHHDTYLSAAPDGVVYSTADGAVRVRTVTGHSSTLARPFDGKSGPQISLGSANAKGVVVSAEGGRVAYVDFAAPHRVTALDSTAGELVECPSVSDDAAACAPEDESQDYPFSLTTALLLPLDGSRATQQAQQTSSCELDDATLVGQKLVFTCSMGAGAELFTQPAGASQAREVSTSTDRRLVNAYGEALVDSADQAAVLQLDGTGTLAPLIAAHASADAVDDFALTSRSIVYTDDQRVSSRPGRIESAFRRTVTVDGAHVRASAPELLGQDDGDVTGNLVAASNALRVYATVSPTDEPLPSADLQVRTSSGATTITDTLGQGFVQVSGDEVLYQTDTSSRITDMVFNASTGRTRTVRTGKGSVALWKHHIAYATRTGSVYVRDFVTGEKRRLAPPLKDPQGVEVDVYAYGSWVAWHSHSAAGVTPTTSIDKIRDTRSMTPAVNVHQTIYSLTSAGVLLDSTEAGSHARYVEAGVITRPTVFSLRTYGGHVNTLLSKRSYVSGPQVAGHLIAWAGPSGQLDVASLAAVLQHAAR